MQPVDRRFLGRVAKELGMSPKWLRELRERARAGHVERGPGRRRKAAAERARVRALVERERGAQGLLAGWRPIYEKLRARESRISLMLVQQELASLKCRERTTRRHATEDERESYEILGRDTIWGEDTTHLGRLDSGAEVTGEVIRDRATLSSVSFSVGGPLTAADVVTDLRRAAGERGGFPLVLQRDNASVYEAHKVVALATSEQVLLLRSRVHTPTDNGATEHAHAEYKGESGLGKGVVLAGHDEPAARLGHARRVLDHGRLRASRGWRTAAELDCVVPRGDAHVDRARFYAAARSAMAVAVLGLDDPDAVRLAERHAILETLCRFGLARRHVGRRPREGPIPTPFRTAQKE
jgi:hypothetical protein